MALLSLEAKRNQEIPGSWCCVCLCVCLSLCLSVSLCVCLCYIIFLFSFLLSPNQILEFLKYLEYI